MGAVAQRHLGWVLVVVLVPPVGGLAWWLAQGVVWARLRRLRAARVTRAAALTKAVRRGWRRAGAGGRLATMAALVTLQVPSSTREQFEALDERVGQSMATAGGPPAGLMSHVVYPEGSGFVVAGVWRSEAEGRGYVDEVLRPLLAEAGLQAQVVEVRPVWSFARP